MNKTILTTVVLFLSLQLFSQININQGLVAYYPLNGNVKDSSGNGNDGTIIGVTPASNRFNQPNTCYFFSGNDHYVDIPAAPSIQPTDAITVSAWVNTTDKDYWNFAVCKRLNKLFEPGNSYFLGATGNVPGGSTWQWSISSSTTQHFLVSNTLVEDSTWLHLTGTFDGDTLKLFLNGQSIGNKIIANTKISYSNLTLKLGLGIPTSSGDKTAWKGYMDEVRIYNRELSEDEIKYLYDPNLLSVNPVSLPTLGIKLYPNPTTNILYLNAETSFDKLHQATVEIKDVAGKCIYSAPYSQEGINTSSLSAGVYFISIKGYSDILKFIKN